MYGPRVPGGMRISSLCLRGQQRVPADLVAIGVRRLSFRAVGEVQGAVALLADGGARNLPGGRWRCGPPSILSAAKHADVGARRRRLLRVPSGEEGRLPAGGEDAMSAVPLRGWHVLPPRAALRRLPERRHAVGGVVVSAAQLDDGSAFAGADEGAGEKRRRARTLPGARHARRRRQEASPPRVERGGLRHRPPRRRHRRLRRPTGRRQAATLQRPTIGPLRRHPEHARLRLLQASRRADRLLLGAAQQRLLARRLLRHRDDLRSLDRTLHGVDCRDFGLD
mmetsp:Transcript_29804/g.96148  ORF Transcript_29804/g.96148 Transcript_29804/m.96148 type:complete len:281 (+) Transcript_29804:348-1190(+)